MRRAVRWPDLIRPGRSWQSYFSSGSMLLLSVSIACADRAPETHPLSRIVLQPAVRLQSPVPTLDLGRRTPVVSSAGFIAAFLLNPPSGGVAVFDSAGELAQIISRRGWGPGEFGQVVSIGFGPGDSLIVIDGYFRFHLFAPPPDLHFVRTVATARPVAGSPTSWGILSPGMVQNDDLLSPTLVGWDGQVLRTYGPKQDRSSSSSAMGAVEAIAIDQIWRASGDQYAIAQLDADGQVHRVITREVAWFPATPGPVGYSWEVRPNPHIADISVDSTGLLWVLVRRAHRNWKPAAGAPTSGSGPLGPHQLSRIDDSPRFEWVLEAFSLSDGALIASADLDGSYSGFAAPRLLAQTLEAEDGRISIRLNRISLAPL